jgi:predicted enzyme related to lactoylglutathione lyase
MGWIHVVIDVPPALADVSARFWSAALGWPVSNPWRGYPEFRTFQPPSGEAYVLTQVGDHGPRVHIDWEADDIAAETARLAGLGATVSLPGDGWQPMGSPGGLPFCLVSPGDHVRPPALDWGAGHRTRLAQVCLDVPARLIDAEVAFWRAATGWDFSEIPDPEFVGRLRGPAGSPVQLLIQCLGADDPGTDVRAHIDLGSDDIDADAVRVEQLGAERIRHGDGWITLNDPAGMTFCTSGNDPD